MNNIEVFRDTLRKCRENARLAGAVEDTQKKTKVYKPEDYPEIERETADGCVVRVTKERTFEAAKNLRGIYPEERICVLNFASAVNPGGGVALGANAQEECLCRCSTLYPCINTPYTKKEFYFPHIKKMSNRYSDSCIYTPDVIIMKNESCEDLPESEWVGVDVITCAAPNLSTSYMGKDRQNEIHKKRGAHILTVAAANGVDVIVLGAFGCGAFRNNPECVAKAYREILPDFMGYFKEIRFAVYYSGNPRNYDTFSRIVDYK